MIADLTARLTRKSRSNFYYAFLTLPRPRREALYAVYAFCRTVDDIADLGGERAADPSARRRGLQRWREDVARCYEPGATPTHPIAMRLQAAVRAYTIPRAAVLPARVGKLPGGRRPLPRGRRDHGADLPGAARGDRGATLPRIRRARHRAGREEACDRARLLDRGPVRSPRPEGRRMIAVAVRAAAAGEASL